MGAAPSKTTAEILQDNKNAIRTSIREIDREERQIERRRKEVEAKIKAAAKKGNVVFRFSEN
jgi:singapore isolate B (sub-type 7) whole genome shotgun sequence assembly, scaffold_6